MTDDTVDNTVDTGLVLGTDHRSCPTAGFSEGPINSVGGTDLAPVGLGAGEEVQQFIQVSLQASHGLWLA